MQFHFCEITGDDPVSQSGVQPGLELAVLRLPSVFLSACSAGRAQSMGFRKPPHRDSLSSTGLCLLSVLTYFSATERKRQESSNRRSNPVINLRIIHSRNKERQDGAQTQSPVLPRI